MLGSCFASTFRNILTITWTVEQGVGLHSKRIFAFQVETPLIVSHLPGTRLCSTGEHTP